MPAPAAPSPAVAPAPSDPADAAIDMQRILGLATKAGSMVEQIRGRLLAPEARKLPPMFSTAQVAALCGVDKAHVNYRVTKGDLPVGQLTPSGGKREFSLTETRQWARTYRHERMRPADQRAICVAVANFKGGVSKTTSAMVLAQGLSMRGHRVLAIDIDPQGSLTTLHGILPEAEVSEEMTISLICQGTSDDITPAIRSTYWDGLDLVAAAPFLFGAEFALPARQTQEPGFEFWRVLDLGIDDVRDEYDVIVIDTPPALSYTTINAFMASDGIIMPLPPNALDFASASQFWSLFSDLAGELLTKRGLDKEFDFIHILLARVDSADAASTVIRQWIGQTYAEKVLPVEIPKTAVTGVASAEFGTIYDVSRYDGNARTFKRARDAYDSFIGQIEGSVRAVWARQTGGVVLNGSTGLAATTGKTADKGKESRR